jgi:hypothetical protein
MNDNNYLEFENFNQDFINKWNNIDNKLKYQKKLYKNKKNINNLSIISLNLNNLIHQIDNNCEKYFQSKINELNLLKSNSNNIKIKNNNKPFIKEKNKKTQKYDPKKTFLKFNNESEQNDKKSIDEILIEQKEENISYYCKEIGNFTSKGLLTIIKSIYNELKNLHNDFLDDKKRTKENNLEKINNKNLIYIQKTIYYIFDKLPITFAYNILEDYIIFKDYVIFHSYVFCFIQILSILLIALYIILETSNNILEEKNVYFFIERLGNTILF